MGLLGMEFGSSSRAASVLNTEPYLQTHSIQVLNIFETEVLLCRLD